MPDLLLHIGLGKTGTSYLQALLRLNRDMLQERFAISYPPRDEPAEAIATTITTGNGSSLLESPESFAEALTEYRGPPEAHLLFSNEGLWKALATAPDLSFLPNMARSAGFVQVRLLLFVRDPIAHIASLSQQKIKRGGDTSTIDTHIAEDRTFETVADLLDRLDALDGVETTLRNYTACSKHLPEALAGWLGIPVDALVLPPAARINRSLTRGELELQRAFNRVLQSNFSLVSDPLCERLPDISADEILPSTDAQTAALDRLAPVLDRIWARLPPDDVRAVEVRAPKVDPETFSFSRAQLEVLADSLGREITRLRGAQGEAQRALLARAGTRALFSALLRRLSQRMGLRG